VNGAGEAIIRLRKATEERVRLALENPSGFDFRSKADGGQLIVDAISQALQDAEEQSYHAIPWEVNPGETRDEPEARGSAAADEYNASAAAYFSSRAAGESAFQRRTDTDWGPSGGGRGGFGNGDMGGRERRLENDRLDSRRALGKLSNGWGDAVDSRGGGGGDGGSSGWGGGASAFGSSSRGGGSRADTEERWR
jgi:hypothetical protein